jgi:hypothetical protein
MKHKVKIEYLGRTEIINFRSKQKLVMFLNRKVAEDLMKFLVRLKTKDRVEMIYYDR